MRTSFGSMSALSIGALVALVAVACAPSIPENIPPQAPASLSGPAFDRGPLYTPPDEGPAGVVLHILHTNDLHGQIHPRKSSGLAADAPADVGGVNALAGYVTRVRQEAGEDKVLLVDSGDIFAGTPEGNLTRGRVMIELMNALDYDAMALGNHEFDLGIEALAALTAAAEFPVLAANVAPKGEARATLPARTIVSRAGLRIGIVGVISTRTPLMTHKEAGAAYDFGDPQVAINDAVGALSGEGVDLVIVLSHLGIDEEVPLLDKLQAPVVALFGGHSHTQVDPMKVSESTGVVYLQTRGKASAVNHLILEVVEGVVTVRQGGPVALVAQDWPSHAAVTEIVSKYAPDIEAVMAEGVGRCKDSLERTREDIESSTLGNFVADVMRQRASAELALTNKTGLRANLDVGQVTIRSLYEVAPFDNTIVTVKLTGQQLRELMEFAGRESRTYLEISGGALTYDLQRPEGDRITAFKVGGKNLDPKKTYLVATNSFLAEGGDGHATFTQGERSDTGVLQRDALIEWLRKEKTCPPLKDVKDARINKK